MECYNCGEKLPSDAERCTRCGQRFKPRSTTSAVKKPSLLNRLKIMLGGENDSTASDAAPKDDNSFG